MPNHPGEGASSSRNPSEGQLQHRKRRRSRHRFETSGFVSDSRSSPLEQFSVVHPGLTQEHDPNSTTGTENAILSHTEEERRADIREWETGFHENQDAFSEHAEHVNTHTSPSTHDSDARPPTSIDAPPIMLNWRALWGLVMTNGSIKLTKEQYWYMRLIADTFSRFSDEENTNELVNTSMQCTRINCLPHYTTLFKTYKPHVFNNLSVRGHTWYSELNIRSAGARITRSSDEGVPLIPVLAIMPSEYAREDVACGAVFDLMQSTSLQFNTIEQPRLASAECIDCWPLVASREWFYGPPSSVSVDAVRPSLDTSYFAETGDSVQITVLGTNDLANAVPFSSDVTSSELEGKVIHIWTVHHQSRRSDSHFSQKCPTTLSVLDKTIIEELSFTSYTSPSDSVQVFIPEVPFDEHAENLDVPTPLTRREAQSTTATDLMRRRRAALSEQRRRVEDAWRGWKKPLLKPGDTVALLEPVTSTSPDDLGRGSTGHLPTKRLCLVHRFWIEKEERGRHVFLLSQDVNAIQCALPTPFHSNDDCFHRDVRHVQLVATASPFRGPSRTKPVSSIGKLDSGESYFIYRFMLYWDGFELASGKAASGDGVYLIPLNLPTAARSSPHAIRVISLTPPGVKAESVFKLISDDIIEGMTTGFLDYDADGNQVRIFLDLVAFIGDTPAINSVLDVLGHTGSACCHLCRLVRRSETIIGSRYAAEGYHSFSSQTARGYYQHTALRDSGAKPETLRLLGLKPTNNEKQYPLHEIRARMLAVQDSIPTTSSGRPIITGHLDPYRACLVAPDHLLTGHFRDCMNCAFGLLPTPEHRKNTEKFIIGLLQDCNLSVQNRLYDHDKRAMYSMSMSEIYSLSVVAEFGFVKGWAFTTESNTSSSEIPEKCIDAIRLLGSCASLIAALWYVQGTERDGVSPSSTFNYSIERNRLFFMQTLVKSHIERVKRLCHMEDEKFHMLENARTSKQAKSELGKEYRACQLAIKSLDKPNLHRLQELVYGTLPMVGSVCRIGELQLEKKHQLLKRAVRQSNHKNAHLQSVQNAILTDWQGRLTLQVPGALERNPKSEFGCYRLLAGRNEIYRLQGTLCNTERQLIHNALGPVSCVPAILASQGATVVSPRSQANSNLTWTFRSKGEIVTYENASISSPSRENAFRLFNRVCALIGSSVTMEFADSIVCTSSNGFKLLTVKCGDVIQDQCAYHADLDCHYPIVNQSFAQKRHGCHSVHTVPLLWVVSCIFSFNGDHWAAVSLCRVLSDAPRMSDIIRPSKKFVMDNRTAFLRLHPGIRPIGVLNDCIPGRCCLSTSSLEISHSLSCAPVKGGTFYVKTRSDGYPPRKG